MPRPRSTAPFIAALGLALLLPAAARANPVPADDVSLLNGAESFERYCTECHGWDPSEQYQELYGEDPVEGLDPAAQMRREAELEAELAAAEALAAQEDDWPDWAGPPPDVEDEDADLKAAMLNDLASAIDDVYGDEEGPYGYEVLEQEILEDVEATELGMEEDVFGEEPDAELARVPGATDLAAPDDYLYGTSETDLFRNIAYGTGSSMPGFLSRLGSEEAVWDLVNYIRSLWGEDWED